MSLINKAEIAAKTFKKIKLRNKESGRVSTGKIAYVRKLGVCLTWFDENKINRIELTDKEALIGIVLMPTHKDLMR